IVGKHLADDEDLVAASFDGFADDFLGAAIAVHLGSVDQRHADLETKLDRGHFLPAFARVLAHAPGALAELGHDPAGRQLNGGNAGSFIHSRTPRSRRATIARTASVAEGGAAHGLRGRHRQATPPLANPSSSL